MAQTDASLARHVLKVFPSLDALFDAGEAAGQLQDHPGWPVVQAVLDAEIASILEGLERPVTLTQAEYAGLHGRISGLRGSQRALVAITTIVDRARTEQAARHENTAEPVSER